MRFREIFRWEVGQRLRHPATWLYLGLVSGLAVLRADATDTGIIHYHAPVNATGSTLMVGILGTLVTAAIFVEAAQRDVRWRMEPLFHTTPLRAAEYLGGRFAGSLLVNALLLLAVPAGLLLGMRLTTIPPDALGTFRPQAYLLPYLVFLLPNLLVSAAVLYGLTVLTRRGMPAYLGALVLTLAYMYALIAGSRHTSPVWALADPTGGVAFGRMTGAWTRVELNTSLVRPEGLLLWNRLLWTALAAGMLALTAGRFRLMHAAPRARRRVQASAAETGADAGARRRAVAVPQVARRFGARTHLRQVREVAAMGVRQVVPSRDFLLVAVAMAGFALISVAGNWIFGGMLYWPVTRGVASGLAGQLFPTATAVLTVFYAGELVWRERDAGIEKLDDSAPVPDWVPLAGKFLALAAMLVVVQAVLAASGMAAQALQGWYAFQPGIYLKILFGVQLAEHLPFAALTLLVHAAVNQKYLGHLAGVLLYVGTTQARSLGIEHSLLAFGADPGWFYSDLNGFGPFLRPFAWFKLYWASWALLLGVAALLLWVRGTDGGARARLRLARRRLTPRAAATTAAALLLVATTGGFVFYNTNVLAGYRTARETKALHAEYERRYKRFEHAPQPYVAGMRVHAELYPEQGRATLRATYRLVNRTAAPIDSIHLSADPGRDVTVHAIRFDRRARQVLDDAMHGYRIHALERPLQPGDSLRMHVDVTVAQRGFRNREQPSTSTTMVGELTNLGSWVLPAVGYQRGEELSAAADRREHGLPPSGVRPAIDDARARGVPRIPRMELEATVGTSPHHVAVVPGRLLRSWTQGGRRWFHYRTEAPVLGYFSILSARYAVRQARWTDVAAGRQVEIRVLHHPDHGQNVDRIVRGAQMSLDYFSREFGPYPHRQLWLVEFPRYASGARAYGGQIVYSEASPMAQARGYRGRKGRTDDPALTLAAHELAHQWWGQQVMGADVQGSQMLSETLAQYGAVMVLERARGPRAARRIVQSMHERYLYGRGRHQTAEVPLLLTEDHDYMHYGKGAVVMYTLREYLGEQAVNTALRRLVRTHGMQGPPYATTLDLYAELRRVTPDSLRYLLHDLLATITLWDLRATGAHAEPVGGGAYRVTLDVQAAKLRSDGVGNHTPVPMDDLVEIGIFAAPVDGEAPGAPLYLRKHRIRSGQQTLTITVPGRPAHAGIDPWHRLIARQVEALYTPDVKLAEVQIQSPAREGGR